jgi:drug/metabolite transporter (DMT)-like permease
MAKSSQSPTSNATEPGARRAAASRRWAGAVLVTLSAGSFASLGILGKMAYASGLGLSLILTLRFTLAAALLLIPLLAIRGRAALPPLRLALILLAFGAFGYSIQATLYFTGLQRLPASLCSMLLYLYPILVALLDWAINRRALGRRIWLALPLALSGVVLTVGPQGLIGERLLVDGVGLAAILASALWYALYILLLDRLVPGKNTLSSAALIAAGAGASFAIFGWAGGTLEGNLSIGGFGIIFALALLSTVIPFATFLAGMARIGPTMASLISTLEPVFTVLLAMLVLGERLDLIQIAGGILVLSAVVLASLPDSPKASTAGAG